MLTAVLALAATNCFAADVASGATGDMVFTATGLQLHGDAATASKTTARIGKSSTGVGIGWTTSTAGYALVAQHMSGTKAYGSSYDSTAIYQSADGTPATVILAKPTATDTTSFSSWKAM